MLNDWQRGMIQHMCVAPEDQIHFDVKCELLKVECGSDLEYVMDVAACNATVTQFALVAMQILLADIYREEASNEAV